MELQDYAAALRRNWATWLGLTLAGVLAALAVVLIAPPSFEATAQVFVASTREENSGWQFVSERVGSYPDIAESRTVLEPVIDGLDLDEDFADLRGRVSATNPPDTSQIDISVTHVDPEVAADIANAVADRFQSVVEQLERPRDSASPVNLTVTDPATASATPVFPVPGLILPLGAVVGLGLGLAAAVWRGHRDTRVYRPEDVRAAWGTDGDRLAVLASPARRRDRGLDGRPQALLARRLEPLAADRLVRVVALTPGTDEAIARAFVENLADELARWGVPVTVGTKPPTGTGPDSAGVHVAWATRLTPMRDWRGTAPDCDVVVVAECGRTEEDDLRELRSVLEVTGVRTLAVVLVGRLRGGSRVPAGAGTDEPSAKTTAKTTAPSGARRADMPVAGR
jgi:capsular polysaccharide biosynthesis protein